MRYTIEDLKYGGKYHAFFWGDLNPNATVQNGLGNCTTMAYGDCLVDGWQPVSRIVNANNWHNYALGIVLPFDIAKVEKGDVLEWVDKCHVAKVDDIINGVIYLNSSWYTGIHGVAIYNGSWDSRPFSNTKELSDFMFANYPTRTHHYWSLEEECRGVGGVPQYIIKKPNIIASDGEDKNINQIEVLTDEQNVRVEPNTNCEIAGIAQSGFFNVYGQVSDGKRIWYQIKNNLYIAGVDGRVVYVEGVSDVEKLRREVELLTKRNAELMNAIEKARKDLEV